MLVLWEKNNLVHAAHFGKPLSSPGTKGGLSYFYGLKSKDERPLCSVGVGEL